MTKIEVPLFLGNASFLAVGISAAKTSAAALRESKNEYGLGRLQPKYENLFHGCLCRKRGLLGEEKR